jgi:hypothetical protein
MPPSPPRTSLVRQTLGSRISQRSVSLHEPLGSLHCARVLLSQGLRESPQSRLIYALINVRETASCRRTWRSDWRRDHHVGALRLCVRGGARSSNCLLRTWRWCRNLEAAAWFRCPCFMKSSRSLFAQIGASCLPPIISPSLGRAHMPQMDAGREVGLILSRACSERVELPSPLSNHTLSRTLLNRSRAPYCHHGS